MKRIVLCCLVTLCVATAGFVRAAAFTVNAHVLDEIQLQVPDSAAQKKYLGVSGTATLNLHQIQADIIILELFSMYCPICQAEAHNVNKVHQYIENKPDLKTRVKLIGIGVGNTPFEVDVFRKKYDIAFPLFPDDLFRVQKATSKPIRTPTFVALKRKGDKTITVTSVHVGAISDVEAFVRGMVGQE
ncbi:MAG TPA: redoxin domain-containing protein [Desulfomonilaceae bacterium]|nr:redoxin domain-containing protein [Desulfomonilaceae bacterium]